jgi:hypothetical protein
VDRAINHLNVPGRYDRALTEDAAAGHAALADVDYARAVEGQARPSPPDDNVIQAVRLILAVVVLLPFAVGTLLLLVLLVGADSSFLDRFVQAAIGR